MRIVNGIAVGFTALAILILALGGYVFELSDGWMWVLAVPLGLLLVFSVRFFERRIPRESDDPSKLKVQRMNDSCSKP